MSQSRLVSTKSEMSWLVSCLDISVLANVSVSEKKIRDSITDVYSMFQLNALRKRTQHCDIFAGTCTTAKFTASGRICYEIHANKKRG